MRVRELVISAILALTAGQMSYAAELPVCSNRVINEVTKRIGCTVGDSRCWLSKGGFCTDYIQKMAGQPGKAIQLNRKIRPENIKKGDIALFSSIPHYAYVESVVRDKDGKPVAVNVSEYNYGDCWVDQDMMVTDKYFKVNRRFRILLSNVDGGFWRP